MNDPTTIQRIMRAVVGFGAFALLGWLLIEGRDIPTETLFALLTLILSMSGLSNIITDLVGGRGGGGGGSGGGSGGEDR